MMEDDLEVAVLGAIGISTNAISHKVRMTPGQVNYRLQKAKIKRSDYRNGISTAYSMVLEAMEDDIAHDLHSQLVPLFTE